jgi:hypothetical protein
MINKISELEARLARLEKEAAKVKPQIGDVLALKGSSRRYQVVEVKARTIMIAEIIREGLLSTIHSSHRVYRSSDGGYFVKIPKGRARSHFDGGIAQFSGTSLRESRPAKDRFEVSVYSVETRFSPDGSGDYEQDYATQYRKKRFKSLDDLLSFIKKERLKDLGWVNWADDDSMELKVYSEDYPEDDDPDVSYRYEMVISVLGEPMEEDEIRMLEIALNFSFDY